MTTHILNLTDGTTPQTVNLASNYADLLEYVPRSPDLSSVDFTPETLRDGGERPITTRRNVTESARVRLHPTDAATTNFITNPSSNTLWAAYGSPTTRELATSWAPYGSTSTHIVADAISEGANAGTVSLTSGAICSASCYVNVITGSAVLKVLLAVAPYTVYATSSSLAGPATGRLSVSWTQPTTASVYLLILSATEAAEFYCDGAQLETLAAATAYCDGDQGPEYAWTSTAHASTSSRVANNDAVRALVRGIERLFQQAQHRQRTGLGTRVYVKFDPANSGTVYRSEVLSGRVDLADAWALTQNWEANETECLVTWTRRYYWEADSETELILSNGNSTGTGGVVVWNHDDGGAGHDNYVAIGGTVVAGAIPAPLRLEIYSNFGGGTNDPGPIYIAHNVFSAPGSLSHIVEAESAVGGAGGTNVGSAIYSAGSARQCALPASEDQLMQWNMSTAQASHCGGNYFRILARFGSQLPLNTKLRLRVQGVVTADIQDGPLFNFNGNEQLADLGVVKIPSHSMADTGGSTYPPGLRLRGYGSGTVVLDYFQLSAMDSYRYFNVTVPPDYTLVDDGVAGLTYLDLGTAYANAKSGGIPVKGAPIHVWPNRDQRLYYLANYTGNTALITGTVQIRAYYRPRRLTF